MTAWTVEAEELQQHAPTLAAAVEAALDHEANDQDLQLLALARLTPRLPAGAPPWPAPKIRWARERYAAAVRAGAD